MTHPDMPADRYETQATTDVEHAAFDAELNALPVQDRVDVTMPRAAVSLDNVGRVLAGHGFRVGAMVDDGQPVRMTAHNDVSGFRLLLEAKNATQAAAIASAAREYGWAVRASASPRMVWVSDQ